MPDKETPLVHYDKPAGVARRNGNRKARTVSRLVYRVGRIGDHLKSVRWYSVETVRGELFGRKCGS